MAVAVLGAVAAWTLTFVALIAAVYGVCLGLAWLSPREGYGSAGAAADMMMIVLSPIYLPVAAITSSICAAFVCVALFRRGASEPFVERPR